MLYRVQRLPQEIDEQLNRAAEAEATGSQYPGMSFEEGVRAGIEWVLGLTDDLPISDPE